MRYFFFFFLFSDCCLGQKLFQKSYGDYDMDEAFFSMELNTKTFLTIGRAFHGGPPFSLTAIKLDSNGTTLSVNKFNNNYGQLLYDEFVLNNKIFFCGIGDSNYVGNNLLIKKGILGSIDTGLNITNTIRLLDTTDIYLHGCTWDSGTKIFCVGNYDSKPGQNQDKPCIVISDTALNLIETKYFISPEAVKSALFDIDRIDSNNFIVTGFTDSLADNAQEYNRTLVAKISSDGSMQWAKKILTDFISYGLKVKVVKDKIYILSTYLSTPTFGYPLLICLDTMGTILNSHIYSIDFSRGGGIDFIDDYFYLYSKLGDLLKLDSSLAIKNSIHFSNHVIGINNLIKTSDGSLFITGTRDMIYPYQDIYVIKSDTNFSSGCNVTLTTPKDSSLSLTTITLSYQPIPFSPIVNYFGSITPDSLIETNFCNNVGIEATMNLTPELQLIENPVKDFLKINVASNLDNVELRLFDITGRLYNIFHVYNGINEINISFLTAGIYLINYSNRDMVSHTFKLIKSI